VEERGEGGKNGKREREREKEWKRGGYGGSGCESLRYVNVRSRSTYFHAL
jgi:hypothetical protein